MVQTKKESVKLFGATIEVPTVRENRTDKSNDMYEKAKVRIKGKEEEEGTTPREKSEEATAAASSIETEQSEVVGEKRWGNSSKRALLDPKEKPRKMGSKALCCPRCHSLNTKFCYFNNYNANQPRHFCRACQRYWTDGGAMRSMPVGAGRRKSKSNSSPHCSHLTIYGSGSLPEAYDHHHPPSSRNRADGVWNPTQPSTPCSSIKQEPASGFHGFQAPFLTGCQFPSTWNPPHAFCASYLPLSFYLTQSPSCFGSQLGKHSRDGETDGKEEWLRIDGDPNQRFRSSKWDDAMGEKETQF